MNFAYVAKSRSGEEITGFLAAGTMDDVVTQLHGQGLVVTHVREDASGRQSSWRQSLNSMAFGGTSTRNLALFSRQLSTVLQSGIPLTRGLRGLAADGTSRTLSRAVTDVCVRIERGSSLSEAMAAHPAIFNRMYLSMIRAGERAGTLDEVVDQLAVYLEKVDAIQNKVKAALSYPLFVLIFAIISTLFLLIKIVPTFAEIYDQMQVALPAYTQLILGASNAIQNNFVFTLALLGLVVVVLVGWGRTRPGRYVYSSIALRLPVFGPIIRKAVMSRFARTFGILTRSGLPIMDSLELVRGTTGNAVVERAITDARKDIQGGAAITESFRRTGAMPEMVLQMMATGEESGELDEMLLKTSDFYDRQVEASVQGLSSLLEPLMIVIVGAMVGLIVVAMFLPIFYLGDAIMRGGYNL
ncbi:MAG: type II secretion system F family protein [Candidatus Krumholzibacteriia bacterium]